MITSFAGEWMAETRRSRLGNKIIEPGDKSVKQTAPSNVASGSVGCYATDISVSSVERKLNIIRRRWREMPSS